jgi:hypothetical protein
MEELSLNAWPAHQTLLYDGWVIRFANGYTKRANSVNPLYLSTIDLDEKIAFCRASIASKNWTLSISSPPPHVRKILMRFSKQKDIGRILRQAFNCSIWDRALSVWHLQ